MVDLHPHDEIRARNVAISASVALGIMIIDFLWLIRDEVKLIWPKLRVSWHARVFMLARYLALASQIFNVCFTVRMYHGIYTSPYGCRLWFIFQAIIVQFLLGCAQWLVMHNLHILFLRSQLILLVLWLFGLFQFASMGVSAGLSFPSNKHTVTCLLMRSNPGNAVFSGTTMTTSVAIGFMTFWRYLHLPVRRGHKDLGWIVMRDSVVSTAAITMVMLFLTLCSTRVIEPSLSGNITYYWIVCILQICIGRLIVNYAKMPLEDEGQEGEGSTWQGTVQLTSQIEMGQSTSSVDTQCGSDGQTPTSKTLGSTLSTAITKASQVSPSSACPSESSQKWFGDSPSSFGAGHSPQPSSTVVSAMVSAAASTLQPSSQSNIGTSEGDGSQSADHSKPDADNRERSPCPRPSSGSKPRPSLSNGCDGDALQSADYHPQRDADYQQHSPCSNPQSSPSNVSAGDGDAPQAADHHPHPDPGDQRRSPCSTSQPPSSSEPPPLEVS